MAPAIFQLLPGDRSPAHLQRIGQGAPLAKTCVPLNTTALAAYGCRHWLRYYASGDDGLGVDPSAWAHQLADECRAAGAWPAVCTPRNEVAPNDYVGVWYARWRMAMEREGCPSSTLLLLPSFPQGTPDGAAIRAIFTACRAEDHRGRDPAGADLHEYADLTVPGSSPWHTLRCKMLLDEGWIPRGTPIYIGECLIDAVSRGGGDNTPLEDPQGRSGWDDRSKMPAGDAAAQLNLYLAQLPPEVVAAAWFADGETPGGRWSNYRSWDTPIETAIRRSWTVPQAPSPQHPIPAIPTAPVPQATPGGNSMLGIDVSSNNGPVDWPQVAASGRSFAFVKATEGTGYVNPLFARDWAAIKAAGMVRGAYHFFQDGIDPVSQALFFLSHVTLDVGDIPVLDIEVGNGDLSGKARVFLDTVQTRAGVRPLVYSYSPFLAAHNLTAASTGNPTLWLAAYQPTMPSVPSGWPSIAIWQHADNANVPGVQGACDENQTALTIDQLKALGKQGGPPVDQLTQDAIARFSALGVQPNAAGALFAAYKQRVQVWQANGKANVLDPTPAIKAEVNTGQDAYVALDCGEIYHWKAADGQVYLAEVKEHDAIFKACGW